MTNPGYEEAQRRFVSTIRHGNRPLAEWFLQKMRDQNRYLEDAIVAHHMESLDHELRDVTDGE